MARILLNLPEETCVRLDLQADYPRLAALGEVVRFDPSRDAPESFAARLREADVMVTGWKSRPLTAADLAGRDRPLLVAHSAGSIRQFVPRELLRQGVRVTQSAAGMATAVAQLTVGFLILALRQAVARSAALRAGEKYPDPLGCRDLAGLTVGLVGLSQVGRRVPPLLAPFGCRIEAYDPYASPELAAALGVTLVPDLDALLARCDALSLHAPVTDETRGMIDARRIGLLQPGTAFVNTARAALVDQDALFGRAFAGELEAYLDVTTPEPLPPEHSAWGCPHVFITPHIAGPTRQTMRRIVGNAIDEVERYLHGRPLESEVTYERYELLA